MIHRITLVLGGARSGKSAYAERLILDAAPKAICPKAIYIATGEAGDGEMAERIAHHRSRRGEAWTTIEEPLDLAQTLAGLSGGAKPILVDCLTLWVSNLILAGRDPAEETARLAVGLNSFEGSIVFVSNEVGLGIVPDNALARAFRDAAGRLNQAIAGIAGRVVFIAAGLPLVLKEEP